MQKIGQFIQETAKETKQAAYTPQGCSYDRLLNMHENS